MSENVKSQKKVRSRKKGHTRREFLKSSLAGVAGFSILAKAGVAFTVPKEPIKIGLMVDRSGIFSVAGIPKYHAAQLAVKEINEKGGAITGELKSKSGLLGRKIKLVAPDMQSDMDRFVSISRILIERDKVDVLMGGFPSSAREAVRPVARSHKMLYFYNTAYEGGVCDTYTICTGLVPEQGFATLIPFMIKKYGPNVYDVAPDYVWGQLGTLWLDKYVSEEGGKVVGKEFIPLAVSDFSSTLTRIQESKADWIMTLLTGQEQMAFFKQRHARGITTPMSDFVITLGQLGYHRQFEPPILSGLHETVSYMEEIPGERSEAFVKRYRAMFPNDPFVSEECQYEYLAIYLWAKAVELAGTTKSMEVIKALETGLTLKAPEGDVKFDATNHHLSHPVYLVKVTDKHQIEIVNKWDNIEPFWLHPMCNLPKKPDQTQYSPLKEKK